MITIFVLFINDIKSLDYLEVNADIYIDAVFFFAIGLYSIEIVLSSIVIKNYLFSFFFWLDIISTLSIIFDISLVND